MSAGGGAAPMSSANILVGNPVERVEDQRFLTGRGRFVANLAAEGLLHAAVRRSEFAHARIVRIDAAAARALPGVAAVITAAAIGESVPYIPLRQHAVPEGGFTDSR